MLISATRHPINLGSDNIPIIKEECIDGICLTEAPNVAALPSVYFGLPGGTGRIRSRARKNTSKEEDEPNS